MRGQGAERRRASAISPRPSRRARPRGRRGDRQRSGRRRRLGRRGGVHVGQDDLPAADGPRGCSARRRWSAVDAHAGAGSTRRSTSRSATSRSGRSSPRAPRRPATTRVGLDGRRARPRDAPPRRGLPVVAIGGITLDTAPAVMAAGADRGRGDRRSARRGEPPRRERGAFRGAGRSVDRIPGLALPVVGSVSRRLQGTAGG